MLSRKEKTDCLRESSVRVKVPCKRDSVMKCPYLKRKTQGTHFYGIACEGKYEAIGHNHGLYDGWKKEYRDDYYCKFCTGKYENCSFYINRV
jgi:hypothetical protein